MSLVHHLVRTLLTAAPPVIGLVVLATGLTLSERFRTPPLVSPPLGEIVRFVPAARGAAPPPSVTLWATRLQGKGLDAAEAGQPCRLEADTLLGTAGSLMVVAVEPGGEVLHVDWAGGPTAAAADCGTPASLLLDRHAFATLRNLADYGMPIAPIPVVP